MTMMSFGYPEYAPLRSVLMHRPGVELDRIGLKTYQRFLFADAIDPERFRRDHERLVDALRSEGVIVALVTDLLKDQPQLLGRAERLPNLVYTRDNSTVTRAGYILTRMKTAMRRKETAVIEAALRQLSVPPLMKVTPPATAEGGDMIFLDGETLLVGIGNRTNHKVLQQIATIGIKTGLRTVVAVPLPPWVIHLDGTVMSVDSDLCMVHLRSLQKPATILEAGKPRRKQLLRDFLRERGMSLIEVTDYERQRRATNVIPLRPRKAVAYNGNARVRRELENKGVDVIEIEGSELIRGSGGPRCMTATILRG
jgi:N-dimethylarginine dimethylaminohydrolase